MKRGKDDEKFMGPMFPRLHVNDTEKGGPRAPPRNKMALYEQLTIPSHRYNPGVVPLNPNSNNNFARSASTSQGSSHVRSMCFPFDQPPLAPSHPTNKLQIHHSDEVNVSPLLAQDDQIKKSVDDDDFMVPIFSQPGMNHFSDQCHSTINGGKNMPSGISNACDKEANQRNSADCTSRQDIRTQYINNSIELVSNVDFAVKDASDFPATNQGHQAKNILGRSKDIEKGIGSTMECNSHATPGKISPNEVNNDSKSCRDENHVSLQRINLDRGDDVSETSIVDSISSLDISPDDVVEIIGLKHFWKARRAIVNQQRVFAVQVFELHRLIKVQKLIAESPNLLLEDSALMGKSSLMNSPVNKFPPDNAVKTSACTTEKNDDSENRSHKMEASVRNEFGKSLIPSPQNSLQPSNYRPSSQNPSSVPLKDDTKMIPWCLPQPAGYQWWVPVMCPSVGLINKSYPGHGFMGPVCGGCGPLDPTVFGNFFNAAYRFPAPHCREGIGFLPSVPFSGQGYFPAYGMPLMNPDILGSAVEQMTQISGCNPNAQMGQFQTSCNMPSQKSGNIALPVPMQATKDGNLQGSAGSSSSSIQQAQGVGMGGIAGGDVLPLFHTAPTAQVSDGAPQPCDWDQPSRVIRVVPRNPRSATESATRILRYIQEEREQQESQ
ncbi:hypothetical protein Nepgr_008800 [Nepenthes gracilis]|uniref:Uncharacterized protein n=1 Tax=Nepenthes gracilis TaxID=150966 RepID=A0AAD3XJQ8_NEPGR|nr:hypothetical protein Nepgr_008800 [Nepenthes gracilis]